MPKKNSPPPVTVIGAGLAGTEATFQLVRRGIPVRLIEMRSKVTTGAHTTDLLAELVCSNSLGSNLPDRASGLLKEELRTLGSYILEIAYKYRVPAGNALAVDREAFSREITRYIRGHSHVEFINEELVSLPDEGPTILATGPLTSPKLLQHLSKRFGSKHLFFFDAVAPVVTAESIDMSKCFRADRYEEKAKGDHLNCPLSKPEYEAFVAAVLSAEKIELSTMEKDARKSFFSACQPIEEIAASGPESLRFGPMKPVGLVEPVTRRRPYAVVQLRQDNLLGSLYNLVGFQTNIRHPEQERVLRMIPALREAKFVRFGTMHRNAYLNAPKILTPTLQVKGDEDLFIGGQVCGVEGYCESDATGLLAGLNVARKILKKPLVTPPPESILGALLQYITFTGHKQFNPMNANFGLFPEKKGLSGEDRRNEIVAEARRAFRQFIGHM